MTCKHCGTEIADKAIVCFRCGAATTDPVLVLLAVYMAYLSRTAANPELPQLAAGLALGTALAVLVRTILRRR
jgi:hypothetical protein